MKRLNLFSNKKVHIPLLTTEKVKRKKENVNQDFFVHLTVGKRCPKSKKIFQSFYNQVLDSSNVFKLKSYYSGINRLMRLNLSHLTNPKLPFHTLCIFSSFPY